ncbi:MAG TPA: hypothetical protein VMV72_01620 [Verrucomicrobiae bacterium]|nr:hypothetical protein [Verrucomicrobiae bacterium]
MRLGRQINAAFLWLLVSCSLFSAVADTVAQTDKADLLGGARWSPDSEWVTLNWPQRPELFLISMKSGVSFTLRPAGDIQLDGGKVFTTRGQPGEADLRHTTRVVASPGRYNLTFLEWSPDGRQAAYRMGWGETNAIFSVLEESVTRCVAPPEVLPWHKPGELQVDFMVPRERVPWMRVRRLDGSLVRDVSFGDSREITLLRTLWSGNVSFLSGNGQFVLYPRAVGSNGWQLVRESLVESNAVPRAITKVSESEPYQWPLSHDDKLLALVEGATLRIGPVDPSTPWPQASPRPSGGEGVPAEARRLAKAGQGEGAYRTISLPHEFVLVRWSPDDRFLALLDGRSLYVIGREDDGPKLVTEDCATQFWGWRGTRLYFGSAQGDLTDLSYVDAEHFGPATQVSARKREWGSATREVSLSPNGQRLICLVPEPDYMGRMVWQLWQRDLPTNADWRLMYELKGK